MLLYKFQRVDDIWTNEVRNTNDVRHLKAIPDCPLFKRNDYGYL